MTDKLLFQAREALQRGIRARARAILTYSLKKEPNNVEAWLLLAEAVKTKEQAVFCLEQVLKIDPQNNTAKKWLTVLEPEQYAQHEQGKTRSIFERPLTESVPAPDLDRQEQPLPSATSPGEVTKQPYQEVIRARQARESQSVHRP